MPDELTDKIKESAEGPESVESDGMRVKQHSLRDQIEADKYLAAKETSRSNRLGVRLVKIVPPGAV
jgi:hypothetical protein